MGVNENNPCGECEMKILYTVERLDEFTYKIVGPAVRLRVATREEALTIADDLNAAYTAGYCAGYDANNRETW